MSSKRDRSASDADASSRKIKSAKKHAADSAIRADTPELKTSDDGEKYWELSAKRRITVSQFKGNTFVNIREFYEKDGKTLPGKGIALNAEQFAVLTKAIPAVMKALAEKGILIDDQKRDESTEAKEDGDEEDEVQSEEE